MGLNKLISMSKNSVIPDLKTVNQKNSKNSSKTKSERENRKEKVKQKDINGNLEVNCAQKNEKNSKSVKVPATTKKSLLWNTLRITNKNKNPIKKGRIFSYFLVHLHKITES